MVCSVCGGPLGSRRECFACLLRAGLDDGDQTNNVLFGDFEIARHEDGSFWELGRGAMGVTYRAADKTLHRNVALKVIETPTSVSGSDAVRERFLREARSAAALRHPNVAAVFQFGTSAGLERCYYAMELVDGETLDALVRREGPLKVQLALEIAIQVSRALTAAEERGLVHRDLKPSNIMLTRGDGTEQIEVKLIDFGLAKATKVENEMELTHGGFVGTPAFASPEQFAGGTIDARSDIYALGVTLWFSLTGQLPYPGRTIEEIRENQKDGKLPLDQLRSVPRSVTELLCSCLAIDPAQRPSARKLLKELESCRDRAVTRRRMGRLAVSVAIVASVVAVLLWRGSGKDGSTGATVVPEKSIAVLPFENLSRDPDNAYFVMGIQDEILTRLSKIGALKVISQTSTRQLATRPSNLPEIARQLGVANILEGSVQRAAGQIHINVQLIRAATDEHLWAESYDRKLENVFGVESEVATSVAEMLSAKLTGAEQHALAEKPTSNQDAYDYYLRGTALWRDETMRRSEAAKPLEEAVRLDPNFAIAWAMLARVNSAQYSVDATADRREAAQKALDSALKLKPDLPEVQLAEAFFQYRVLRDYNAARRSFERLRPKLPNNVDIPEALYGIAENQGRFQDGRTHIDEAVALNPRDRLLRMQAAWARVTIRDFTGALRAYSEALSIWRGDTGVISSQAFVYQRLGDLERAKPLIELLHPTVDDPTGIYEICNQERFLGQRSSPRIQAAIVLWKAWLEQKKSSSPTERAGVRKTLGDLQQFVGNAAAAKPNHEQARDELEQMLKEQPANADWICQDLALTYAGLNDRERALEFADRSIELTPPSEAPWALPQHEEARARIAARFGMKEIAIPALEHLLKISYEAPLTPAILRFDPDFDLLRDDARFQKLVTNPE